MISWRIVSSISLSKYFQDQFVEIQLGKSQSVIKPKYINLSLVNSSKHQLLKWTTLEIVSRPSIFLSSSVFLYVPMTKFSLTLRSGSEGHRFETRCQQGLFDVEYPLKCTHPLVICIPTINSCARCIG